MANTVTLLSYANTYGDWMVTTNQLIQENNNFATGIYNKNLGTLYLNDPTLGLQVTSNAIFSGQLQVSGVGSSAYVQNNLRVDGQLILTNTSIGIATPGVVFANGPNTGLYVANNAYVANTIFASNVNVGGVDLATYIDINSQGLRANDFATLMLADDHINQANAFIRANIASRVATSTLQVQNLIDANNATAYVKGIVVGSGGFSVGGSGGGTGNSIALDGTVISNSTITFPYSATYANGSIIKNRTGGGAAYNAELRWNETSLVWEVRDVIGSGAYSKIISADLLSDSVTSTSSSTVATSKAANTIQSYFQGVDNSQNTFASAAFAIANAAYQLANTSFSAANTANDSYSRQTANAAYGQANVATVLAQAGFNVANTGLTTAQLAYTAANNALDVWVRGQANAAYNIGQSSYDFANTLSTYSQIGFGRANSSANLYLGTSGSARPNTGGISYSSDNGVTIVGSGNTLTVSTSQDLRTTASPTFNGLSLTNALPIGQGGTGGTSSNQALTNLLPTGAVPGYVLATNGPGSYYWSAGGGGTSLGGGTLVASTRLQYTANGNGTAYTVPLYAPGSNQLRVYFDGVRQFDDYVETSNTIVSFTRRPAAGVQVLFEVDGYSIVPNFANVIPYTANTLIGLNANTVQLAIDALLANVAFKGNTTLAGTPTAPTAANTTANTMIATTQYVQNVLGSGNTFAHNISGNANTVNNGVYITGSYANPAWITSIANTKIAGNIISTQITSVANTQITGNITASQLAPTGVVSGVYGNTRTNLTITVDGQGRISSISNLTSNIANTEIFGLITASQLAPTGVISGTYGGATQHAVVVVDAQGRILGAANVTPSIATTQLTGTIANTQLASTTVVVGTYGGTTKHSVFTVDQQGRITSAANVDPSIANTQITGLITDAQIATVSASKISGSISATSIANTGIIGVIRAAQLENTTVTPGVYGSSLVHPVITVDQQGRVTSIANVAQTYTNVPNTAISGLITSAQIATVSSSQITGSISASSIANTGITGLITDSQIATVSASKVTGTITSSQLVSNVQFTTVNVGGTLPMTTGTANGFVRVGNSYLSSGGDYTLLGTRGWFNGFAWQMDNSNVSCALYQQVSNTHIWYRGVANTITGGSFVTMMNLDSFGDLTPTGNLKTNQSLIVGSGTPAAAPGEMKSYGTHYAGLTGAGQFVAVAGGGSSWFNAQLRNDGSDVYLLSSNTQTSNTLAYTAQWNNFRPIAWNLLTGTVRLDTGTQFGGVQIGSYLGVGTTPDTANVGSIRAIHNITAYFSDERLKKKLGTIENALDKVSSLEGFYYEANDVAQKLGYKPNREVGVSAQQVQKVLPEVVVNAPVDERYLTVHYERLIPLLIEAIKELKQEVEELKGNNK
jgi:hypothetical protein